MGILVIACLLWLVVGLLLVLKRSHKGTIGCGWMVLAALLGPFEFFLATFFDSLFDD